MVVIGVVGVLALPLVHMVSVCGKILEGGDTLSLHDALPIYGCSMATSDRGEVWL